MWLTGIFDRIFVVLGAFLFVQLPVYIQSYTQRLAGHTAELSFQVAQLKSNAHMAGKTLEQYIDKFIKNADPDFSGQGRWMQQLVERLESLQKATFALQEASPLSRPFYFFQHFNLEIARPVLEEFQPGLLFTFEGAIYALVGAGVGYLFFRALVGMARSCANIKFLSLKKG